jgi:ABC-type polysaccharide/polyol phosphate transport system ATPase subunit
MNVQHPFDNSAPAASAQAEALLEVQGVSKKYCRDFRRSLQYAARDVVSSFLPRGPRPELRTGEFWAVRDVSLTLRRGDSLGVVGRNGAGKSTLLKILTGQRMPTTGRVVSRGRVVALTELGLGFDPVLSGRENAYINASVFGVSRRQLEPMIRTIVEFAGLEEFIDSAVQTYSSGMKARLAFAVATHLEPDILIVDEVLAVGDFAFRLKCIRHIHGFLRRGGSLVLVSHEPHMVQTVCNRCLVLEHGSTIFEGDPVEGVDLYMRLERSGRLPGSRPAPGAIREEPTPERPVAIDSLTVSPLAGTGIVTGADVMVTLTCRSLIEAEAAWGFSICTPDVVTAITSCTRGLEGRRVTLRPGVNRLQCRIPRLAFRPGTYAIRGALLDGATLAPVAMLGFKDLPEYFTVKPCGVDRLANVQTILKDLVEIDVEWLD